MQATKISAIQIIAEWSEEFSQSQRHSQRSQRPPSRMGEENPYGEQQHHTDNRLDGLNVREITCNPTDE